MKPLLTWREEKVFKILTAHARPDGSLITMREVARLLGLSSHSSIAVAIENLCLKGYLFRRPGRAHSNTHNGRVYSLTPVVEPPKLEVLIYLTPDNRFSHFAASPKIQVKIRRLSNA